MVNHRIFQTFQTSMKLLSLVCWNDVTWSSVLKAPAISLSTRMWGNRPCYGCCSPLWPHHGHRCPVELCREWRSSLHLQPFRWFVQDPLVRSCAFGGLGICWGGVGVVLSHSPWIIPFQNSTGQLHTFCSFSFVVQLTSGVYAHLFCVPLYKFCNLPCCWALC